MYIIQIRDKTLKYLESQKNFIPEIERKCDKLRIIINSGEMTEKNYAIEMLMLILHKLASLDTEIEEYLKESDMIIKETEKQPVKKVFFGKNISSQHVNKNLKKLKDISTVYIQNGIYSDSLNEFEELETKSSNSCPDCGGKYEEEIEPVSKDPIYMCTVCGSQTFSLMIDSKRVDTDRIGGARYKYNYMTYMNDAINSFEGKAKNPNAKEIITPLKNKIELCGITTPTKIEILLFLRELGYTEYYQDLNYFYFIITELPCPNLDNYRPSIFAMYSAFVGVYTGLRESGELEIITGTVRTSNPNIQFVLYKILQLLGYKCLESDFKIPKNSNNVLWLKELWIIVCKKLDWKLIN